MGHRIVPPRHRRQRFGWAGALLLLAAGAGGAALACGDEPEEEADLSQGKSLRCDREGLEACAKGGRCGEGLACFAGCCLPRCTAADQCEEALECGALGCECDLGVCQQRVCSADVDCGAELLCEAGTCAAPPALEEVGACALEPRFGVSRQGLEARRLSLQLYDRQGEPLPLFAGPISASTLEAGLQLRSSAPARGAVEPSGALVGGAEAGPYRITATLGDVSCASESINHAALEEGEARVVVIDELSGLPVEGATVRIGGSQGDAEAITGEDGAARFALGSLGDGPRDVSVFHHEHMYLSLVQVDGDDLLLPLRRSIEPAGASGFEGAFDPGAFDPALLNAGLVGMSLPGNLVDLSFSLLLGPAERIRIEIGSAREVDVPRGLVIGLGNTWFKSDYRVVGMAGVCEDLEEVRAGRCGTWSAWGLAGGMPLEELPIDELTAKGSRMDIGQLLAHLLPQVKSFKSAVVRDVTVSRGEGEGAAPVQLDLRPELRLGLHPILALPELPKAAGGSLDGVIAMGGALHPVRGFVPLGITAGVDSGVAGGGEASSKVVQPGGKEGELALRLAPLHGGLEGSRYALIAVAANLSRLMEDRADCERADRSDCVALAAVMRVEDRIKSGAAIELGGGSFVGFAEEASFDPEARRLSLNGEIEGGPNLLRLTLGGPSRRWIVYFSDEVRSFAIPAVPLGFEDRAAGARASLQAMRVEVVGLEELWGFGPLGLRGLAARMSSFSSADLPAPAVGSAK